jgi:thiol-disulfide isomerase/thioredoxin
MRHRLSSALVLALAFSGAVAAQEPAKPASPDLSSEFEGLVTAFENAQVEFRAAMRADAEKRMKEMEKRMEEEKKAAATRPAGSPPAAVPAFAMGPSASLGATPEETFAPQFAAFAAKAGTTPAGTRALVWLVENAWNAKRGAPPEEREKTPGRAALATLLKDHLATAELAEVAAPLGRRTYPTEIEGAEASLRTLIATAKHPEAVAAAHAHLGKLLYEDEGDGVRSTASGRMERFTRVDAEGLAKRRAESKELFAALRAKFPQSAALQEAAGTIFEVERLQPGMEAPDFEYVGVDGKPVKLSAFRGKVVAIDFWATWCGPCMALVPHAIELQSKLSGEGFTFLGFSADRALDDLTKELTKRPLPWPNVFMDKAKGKTLSELWNVRGYPTLVLVDRKGVIRHRFLGVDAETLDKAIAELVAEKP